MKTYRIALYPGDGIGPEVVDAALDVLAVAEQTNGGFHLDFHRFDWGMDHYDRHGRVAPENFLAILQAFDAILLGAVGWPAGSLTALRWRRWYKCVRRSIYTPTCGRRRLFLAYPVPCETTGRSIWSWCGRTPKGNT